jgi:methyltransferase (TIGR00027 family)
LTDGQPSLTAQHVAAARAEFERLSAPYGDPDADVALAREVAGSGGEVRSERMTRHLEARTAFFDRVVVRALERGTLQVISVAAGYDGRALRYAKPGVRWFEVDLGATQRDKRARLERLGIDDSAIVFVGFDVRVPGLADALLAAGVLPDAPTLIISEGLLVYLEEAVVAALAAELRALATAGTRLAVSSCAAADWGDPGRRAEFERRLAEMGEPTRNRLDRRGLTELLDRARWRVVELSERAQWAGFIVAAPRWAPAPAGARATLSHVGAYMERLYYRAGSDGLPGYLETTYETSVREMHEIDVGVWRVRRGDGPDWLARVFPSARPAAIADADAELLRVLACSDFPAERCAHDQPVSAHCGQAVLVTEYVRGKRAPRSASAFRRLGDLLGRLHGLGLEEAVASRPGGAWHHLAYTGGPGDELAAARELLDSARDRVTGDAVCVYDDLVAALARADSGDGLPEGLIHADFVPANAIASSGGELVIVDWAGAGRGPRLWALAFLLWAAMSHIDAVMAGYRKHVDLEPGELERLPDVLLARPLVFMVLGFANGSQSPGEVRDNLERARQRIARISARVRRV